jgi:hypothetical protein
MAPVILVTIAFAFSLKYAVQIIKTGFTIEGLRQSSPGLLCVTAVKIAWAAAYWSPTGAKLVGIDVIATITMWRALKSAGTQKEKVD